ncbi:MAG TPA: alpha/beta hydrolase, partial [Acidimicrobiales bacterium]|nr:alpha/beta hydrolase [Acidimicrobiales bacterium]
MSGRSAPERATTDDGVEIELAWSWPAEEPWAVAVVTHPHPRMGGDMHNPVPDGVARGLADAGVAAVRLNFRGTGASGGDHGGGAAEVADILAAVDAAAEEVPGVPVLGVGYSFGADVLLAVDDERLAGVVAVAPPLRVLPVEALRAPRGERPTLVLSPAHDQFCDPSQASSVVDGWPETTVEPVPGCDHFLAGGVQRV